MKITHFVTGDGISCVKANELEHFLIHQIFDCGQCFRFDPVKAPRHKWEFEGVAYGRYLRVGQDSPDSAYFYNVTPDEFDKIWRHYFALDVDYGAIQKEIRTRFKAASNDPGATIELAMKCGEGIRILRQDPWETVCSFIISQNNNIPRIKKIIAAISRTWGDEIKFGDDVYYTFPTAKALADAGVDAIFAQGTGFRAKYIYDAACKIASGELDLQNVFDAEFDEAAKLLCTVKGIGPKVASCTLLFAFEKTEAFPIDVWIARVLEKYYPDGLDIKALGRYAGIAQQYLFYYERYQN